MPRTQRLSLIAIGTPASGPAVSPAARRASTLRARSSAPSASTRRKLFSAGFAASMRARASRQISTAETRPAATSSRMARAVGWATSAANHARHAEETGVEVRVGRIGDGLLRGQRRTRRVVALGAGGRMYVRGGGHALGVHRLQLLCVIEDVGELAREPRLLVARQIEVRQRRDALDVGY